MMMKMMITINMRVGEKGLVELAIVSVMRYDPAVVFTIVLVPRLPTL